MTVLPLIGWIACAFAATCFGVNILHSLNGLASFAFFSFLILAVSSATYSSNSLNVRDVIFALVCGQSLAALHSMYDGMLDDSLPRFFLGEVTESGQLAITFFLAIGLGWYLWLSPAVSACMTARLYPLLGLVNALLFTTTGFSAALNLTPSVSLLLGITASVSIAIFIYHSIYMWRINRNLDQAMLAFLIHLAVPLITAALCVNLKRGPWLGVLIAGITLLACTKRKLVLPIVAATVLLAALLPPVRERISLSYEHFMIHGGRYAMWEVGVELAGRFPTGIGFDNSEFMRDFSTRIPPQHDHMHNNILNILVETGWLGLVFFVWWLASILRVSMMSGHTSRENALLFCCGCAILSWQVAGLVEYNFGDSEVLYVVFIVLGIMSSLLRKDAMSTT